MLIAILLISGVVFWAVSMPRHVGTAEAKGGVLDLSDADFDNLNYPLNGEWEFYYEKLYTPADFAQAGPQGAQLVALPVSWEDMGYTVPAYGTFRLILDTGEHRRLMIHIPEIAEAGKVWLNGELVYDAGDPSPDGFRHSIKNAFVSLVPLDGKTEIVIQAASGASIAQSGLTYRAWVGSEDVLLGDAMLRRVALAAAIGAMLMMALYHLVLFLFSRRDRIYLWYVLYMAVAVLRMSMETNGLIQLLAPNGMDEWLGRAYLATFAGQVLFLALFTFEAFGIPYWPKKTAWRIVYGICGGILAVNILVYLIIPGAPGSLALLSIIPFLLFIIAAAYRMAKDRPGAYLGLYLVALFIFFFWGLGVKLYAEDIFYTAGAVSNIFMAMAQGVMLSVGYAANKRRAADLERKTDFYHRMSHDLLTPLTRVSTNVQTAKRLPEQAGELLEDAQADIMRMAEMINVALREDGESE